LIEIISKVIHIDLYSHPIFHEEQIDLFMFILGIITEDYSSILFVAQRLGIYEQEKTKAVFEILKKFQYILKNKKAYSLPEISENMKDFYYSLKHEMNDGDFSLKNISKEGTKVVKSGLKVVKEEVEEQIAQLSISNNLV